MTFLLIAVVGLSLKTPDDYQYVKVDNLTTNEIRGFGMGGDTNTAYHIVRAEDMAFLREAYEERKRLGYSDYMTFDYLYATGSVARLWMPVPGKHILPGRYGYSSVFNEADRRFLFQLSHPELTEWANNLEQSYVPDSWRFPVWATARDAIVTNNEWVAKDSPEYHGIRLLDYDNNQAGREISTNAVPLWDFDNGNTNSYRLMLSRYQVCRMYASLTNFHFACELAPSGFTNRIDTYVTRGPLRSAQLSTKEYEWEDADGRKRTSSYENAITNVVVEYPQDYHYSFDVSGDFYISETRDLYKRCYFGYEIISARKSKPYYTFRVHKLGSVTIREPEDRLDFESLTNDYLVNFPSTAPTNLQDKVEIKDAVFIFGCEREFYIRRSTAVDYETYHKTDYLEETNYVNRAILVMPAVTRLTDRIDVNGRRIYEARFPLSYLYKQMDRFGTIWSGSIDGSAPIDRIPDTLTVENANASYQAHLSSYTRFPYVRLYVLHRIESIRNSYVEQ